LAALQKENAGARSRCVGLVIETRPDLITPSGARKYRLLGCTKIQLGIQSVDEKILAANGRAVSRAQITKALAVLRLFGFKLHTHFMCNLIGSYVERDIADFREFVTSEQFLPDEIKLYPCALIANAPLKFVFEQGGWRPYSGEELLQVLVADMKAVPRYVRISRMIRDFSADDIMVGNKKTNFRQLVDQELARQNVRSLDIRSREIRGDSIHDGDLRLHELAYVTSVSREYFLEWVTPDDKIVGFLRLSIPDPAKARDFLPPSDDTWNLINEHSAMIREVHVYGLTSRLGEHTRTQHLGLGKKLIARAEAIARENGRGVLRVISSVGTREYYGRLGFVQEGVYQVKNIN